MSVLTIQYFIISLKHQLFHILLGPTGNWSNECIPFGPTGLRVRLARHEIG